MVILIAAICENMAIGLNNRLLYRISEDLKRFRKITIGKTVLMGRKTFESLPAALPGRRNIVAARSGGVFAGAESAGDLALLLREYKNSGELYVIGGGQIYTEAIPYARRLLLTFISAAPEADCYFPEIDKKLWHISEESDNIYDEANKLSYRFITYERTHKS